MEKEKVSLNYKNKTIAEIITALYGLDRLKEIEKENIIDNQTIFYEKMTFFVYGKPKDYSGDPEIILENVLKKISEDEDYDVIITSNNRRDNRRELKVYLNDFVYFYVDEKYCTIEEDV